MMSHITIVTRRGEGQELHYFFPALGKSNTPHGQVQSHYNMQDQNPSVQPTLSKLTSWKAHLNANGDEDSEITIGPPVVIAK